MGESTPLQGALFIWSGYWLFYGSAMRNRRHKHVSASVLIGLDGPIRVEVNGAWQQLDAAIVAPEVEQSLDSDGHRTVVIHLDPDQRLWRHFAELVGADGFAALPRETLKLDQLQCAVSDDDINAVQQWLFDLANALHAPPPPQDPRVEKVCAYLRRQLPERIELPQLSQVANLSGSRITHLFKQQTGVTLRRFLAHLKIQQALFSWRPGMQVAELAALAGFYDQPHLLRTAREMFDAMPSVIGGSDQLKVFRDATPRDD